MIPYFLTFVGSTVQSLTFPSRRLFGNRSVSVSHERRALLETYLNALIQICAGLKPCPLHNNPSKRALIQFSAFFEDAIVDNDIGADIANISEQTLNSSIPNSPRSDNSDD